MKTASLFIQKLGVVLSGKASHLTVNDAEKLHPLRVGARILIKGKIYESIRDVATLIKKSNDSMDNGLCSDILKFLYPCLPVTSFLDSLYSQCMITYLCAILIFIIQL